MDHSAQDLTGEAQQHVARRDRIVAAITRATEIFLRGSLSTWQDNVLQVLTDLGSQLGASRIYLCKNYEVTADHVITGVRYQWVRQENKTAIDVPELQQIHLQNAGFSRWAGILYHGGIIHGWISDLPLSERGWFMSQTAQTLVVVPVFVEKEWWGFIGIEDYDAQASASPAELDAFKTLGVIFGAATRRKRTEEALQREKAVVEQRVREVQDVARFPAEDPSPVLRVSAHGVILYANKAADELLDYWQCHIGEQLPDKWKQVALEVIEGGESQAFDITVPPKILSVLFVPMSVNGYVNLYGRDVTHQRQSDQIKSQFISMASHQLRTPLTSLRWYSEKLLKKPETMSQKQKEAADIIHQASIHMAKLVDDLLSISRIESGKLEPKLKRADICDLIRQNITQLQAQADAKKQTISFDAPTSLELVFDPDLVRQVHLNLLQNAIKYTPEGKQVSTSLTETPDDIVITVIDEGIGIPLEEQPQIFQRFYRAKNAVDNEEQGTGLGLSVAKMIVENYGGKIGFNSKENEGSQFYFTIPKDMPTSQEAS